MTFQFFATTPKALEDILTNELRTLGITEFKATTAGVAFSGDLEMAYRVCLWSRVANRVLLVLSSFEVRSQDDLYRAVQQINWFEHFGAEDSFAVSFSSKNSTVINNSHFGALKVKDAIVDQMRTKFGVRPSINTERPNLRINVHLNGEKAELSLDLSGESLHRRGYRDVSIEAPMKENLAAAMLLRCGWAKMAAEGKSLLDPMCGSGTLLLEGAMIAADVAPALGRDYFGFLGWKKHDAECWQKLRRDAEWRKIVGMKKLPMIVGFDKNKNTVNTALVHVANAGFQGKIHIERRDICDAKPPESWEKGLVICNPPYGERLGDEAETAILYEQFGKTLKTNFVGWQAALIISNPELGFRLGIRSHKPITLFNGALECRLLRLTIEEKAFFIPKERTVEQRIEHVTEVVAQMNEVIECENKTPVEPAPMFANRLQKNLKKLSKWAKQHMVFAYRVYDADLPEYAVAVDIYHCDDKTWVNVQEYEPPKSVDQHKADMRLAGLLAEIPSVLNVSKEQVLLKIRRKQRNTDQYEKQAESGIFHEIIEGGCRLLVNFEDYLDTGIFLDHRPIRLQIQKQAKGKRFLNLFAYTGSATVHAAMGGATVTTTVDMSNTYLQWAKNNLALNSTTGRHEFIQADCVEWLEKEAKTASRQYDLIFLDPPTFSNSKRMENVFDVQLDYIQLIQNAAKLLTTDGTLYFSTNFRKFKFDESIFDGLSITDITAQTIPEDFARDMKIHYCWQIIKT
ncbi:MAG: bifunctional 23S rRNA (guanine(2069)-N(7))-methyltransferase RlmK/23S rRNA (guanine(2445)-N(2))-methyltransferase RlmL [Methylococcales bacterium]|nr:bifunctional 23S rRNA (guanine(2069)-N(7))-methyltransferase RlmK/23S rRNA (guanine(2445)-N(2))-methyltransferase RlmL [Methylococcales bacterium]MDD5753738.1 bifunctional 23S rRNA (guanine(2069)-N(7))-methyltransferase RlmK/23S rRNA (guanine(2445)-N(2))-methyltransferase RlmL [Methylococcales bacterium]